ncbi:MAG: ATP synthase F1 subunit epsilon [Paludibacteraceae bacterium]|nr:ATP synthase F1 subunit epsilon [Paludibacteraceae bacterium]
MVLEIISPEKMIFKGKVESVNLPGTAGGFTVLPRHAALISSLKEGEISYISDGNEKSIKIDSGFAEVRNDVVSVCIENVIE